MYVLAVLSLGLIKMADVVITFKIMPEGLDVDLNKIVNSIKKVVKKFGGDVGRVEEEPVAFGLKALKIIFVIDENKGSTDDLEEEISKLKGVKSVNVVDVRRAIG